LKILLVNPPYVGWLNDIKVEPIGLLYIAAHLRDLGHDIALYDPYIGENEAIFIDLVTHWRPRIVASAAYTVSEQFCFDLARLTKQIDPSVVFVAGGPHATFAAERMLRKCAQIDAITLRESEETLASVASAVESKTALEDIPGVSCRAAGRIVTTTYQPLRSPIDGLAFPAKDLLSDRYYDKYRATGVITARGCAYKCDFCVSPAFFKGVRQRDLAFVAMELRELMRQRDIRHVRFYDDVFAYNAAKMRRLKEHIGPLGLTFDCYIRVDVTTPEMLELMKACGCVQVRFGVETGDDAQRSRRKGGRTVSFEKHAAIVDKCRQLGIETQASYILGFPGETREDMLRTVEFAERLDTDAVGFYKLTPYPGTVYWQMLDENTVPLHNYCKFDNEVSVNEYLSSEEIFAILTEAYESFYRKRKIPYDRPDTLRFLTSLPKLRY
jgi:magnesium-protoporphyrin IX monomethyl ester (oxidative) cyclase